MKKIIIVLLIVLVVGIGTYYLVFNNNNSSGIPIDTSQNTSQTPIVNTSSSSSNNPVTSTPTNTVPSSANVSIKNFSFNPAVLNIKIGTKVTWTNNDTVSHTVTSDSGNLLNSAILSPGQSFSFTFTNPGSVNYHCSIHTMMKGSIIVKN